jgi:hypothetical protein
MSLDLVVQVPLSIHDIKLGALVSIQSANGFKEIMKCEVVALMPPRKAQLRLIAIFDQDGRNIVRKHSSLPQSGAILDVRVEHIKVL